MAKKTKDIVKMFGKESKADLFNRLGKARVIKVLDSIRILGNCSNKSSYEYTIEQVDKMKITLTNALDKMILKFQDVKKEQESFEY